MEGEVAISWRQLLAILMRKSNINIGNLVQDWIPRIKVSNIVDSRLKETILLTILQESLSEETPIAEWMLTILEQLEDMYRSQGSPITDAMAAAYCGVAVDCMLRYLANKASHPSYIKAVDRIWCATFPSKEPSASGEGSRLFSADLSRWITEIEASLSDPQVMHRLAATSLNTRRDAVEKLKLYLVEAWLKLGVPAPEQHQQRKASSGIDSVSSDEVPEPPTPTENQGTNINEKTSDQSDVHPPGLMEPSSTPRTHELNDSTNDLLGGTSNQGSGPHFPSQKRTRFPPQESSEEATIKKRRKVRRWSKLEHEVLTAAVTVYGKGSWKTILSSHRDVFNERTDVDLKDKWRNLTRYGKR